MLHLVFFDEDKGRTFDYKRENAFGLFSLSSIPLRSIPEREKRKVLHLLIELKNRLNSDIGTSEAFRVPPRYEIGSGTSPSGKIKLLPGSKETTALILLFFSA